jgi:hypothetical protein
VKRLLILLLVIAVAAAMVWGVLYLEAMRKQSAEAARLNSSRIIETAPADTGPPPR